MILAKKLPNKRFWIAWLVLLLLVIVSCIAEGWSEDIALLGAALCTFAVIDVVVS